MVDSDNLVVFMYWELVTAVVYVLGAASHVEMEFVSVLCFILSFANVVYTSTDSFVGM